MTFDSPRNRWLPCAPLAVLLLVGCTDRPYDVASVSGRITLDGQPLSDASIRFQPQRRRDSAIVGPGSIGQTDAEGRYEMMTYKGESGAVVGDHRVSVSTYASELVDPDNSDEVRITAKERVPPRYRTKSELTFTVPSSGSDEANFDLQSQ